MQQQELHDSLSSAPSARLERMKMYQERYKYQPPAPYSNHSARDQLCGSYPDFEKWFSNKKTGWESIRSDTGNKEDETIYNIFFKDDTRTNNGTDPIRGSIVEMGAYNGLNEANSHFYDVCLGWETMLVEGNPVLWDNLVANRPHTHRFSYTPSCTEEEELANKTVKFDQSIWTNGGLADGSVNTAYDSRRNITTAEAPCGSLTKVLLDVFPHGHVSFFSLDVEGAEPLILRHLEFDKVFIELVMIENRNNFCKPEKCESREQFRKIMTDAGYILFERMVIKSDLFIHPLSKHLETAKKKNFTPLDPTQINKLNGL
eukprot:CAMPEP_0195284838 /NCGR_PEP_ID=MMETSP0707-20130614/2893_1 /TAXON_ID=33640 /ORGANISM="Asterionellopsis glacialis, Strain CCMP134" /LENGTH=315 /DNA_ID=CAMNT_0040344239 /DNA_START=173 /DNA_END=1120 /DNA_ORIENTATION=-